MFFQLVVIAFPFSLTNSAGTKWINGFVPSPCDHPLSSSRINQYHESLGSYFNIHRPDLFNTTTLQRSLLQLPLQPSNSTPRHLTSPTPLKDLQTNPPPPGRPLPNPTLLAFIIFANFQVDLHAQTGPFEVDPLHERTDPGTSALFGGFAERLDECAAGRSRVQGEEGVRAGGGG